MTGVLKIAGVILLLVVGACSLTAERSRNANLNIDWGTVTPAEVEEMILSGRLSPDDPLWVNENDFSMIPIGAVIDAQGNPDIIDVLVKHGADIEQVLWEKEQMGPLDFAVQQGRFEIVRRLLELGAEIQPKNKRETPVSSFALLNYKLDAESVIKTMDVLLENGSDINVLNYRGEEYQIVFTPLMEALYIFVIGNADVQKQFRKIIFHLIDRGRI